MSFKIKTEKCMKWLFTTTSVFTMVMMPVTQGQAAQSQANLISKIQVQNSVTTLGLNKSMTLGEFYKKNKNLYPSRIASVVEKLVAINPNYVMPQFEVTTVKNSDGSEVPTIRISKDAELVNLQIYGEPDKYVKFNNTNLTEVDIVNFTDMYLKLNNGDANLRKQVEVANSPSTKFTGIPEISKDIWIKMSVQDKAEYVLNMRLLWADAHKILILKDPKLKKQKTSQFDFLWNVFVNDAFAQNTKRIRQNVQKNSGTTIDASSENCLVAGYVSSYSNGSCGVRAVQDSYKDEKGIVNPIITKAQGQCSEGSIACNPFIYGMPGGNAICVSTKDPQFQIATHANGPCDTASPLGTEINFLNKDLKNNKRYSTENLKLNPNQLAEEYSKQQKANSAYVQNYLKGFLGAGVDFNSALDNSVLDQIINIKKAFDNDISKAQDSCKAAAASNKYNEKNFWGACDQLQRRFLFVAEFLEKTPGCKDGSIINPSTLKCICTDSNKSEINPGAKCPVVAVVAPVVPPTAEPVVTEPRPELPKPNEFCDGEKITNSAGAEVCIPNKTGPEKINQKEKPAKEKDSWFTGLFNKILPWVIGGVALFAMYKLWAPKQPVLNQPLDACPNGQPRTNAPCQQTCQAPLSPVNGTCACASCAPGQTMTNYGTCTCSTTSTNPTTPTLVTCPDGVTKVSTLSQCPATLYTCWNNTTVTNPLNCPEKPATNPPNTKTER